MTLEHTTVFNSSANFHKTREPDTNINFQQIRCSSSKLDCVYVSGSMQVEQRVEPAKKAAQVLHKKLQGCMQSQLGLEAEKRMVLRRLHSQDVWKHWDGYQKKVCLSTSLCTEKAPSDAAVCQHGGKPQRLRCRVLYQVTGLILCSYPSLPPSTFFTWTLDQQLWMLSCENLKTPVLRY